MRTIDAFISIIELLSFSITLPKKTKTTTIAVEVKVQKILEGLKRGREDYNDVIKRLLGESQGEIYAEFILVDNELAQLHTCVFQLGEDKDALFFFDGQFIKPITLEETNKLMKQPKPILAITREEARVLHNYHEGEDISKLGKLPEWDPDKLLKVLNRITDFLEVQESA